MDTAQIEKLKVLAPELRSAANLIRQWLKAIAGTTNWNDCAQANACDAAAEYFERLRAELATGAARQGGSTSENMVVGKPAENGAKTVETRMGTGFAGGGQISAPAAETERDAERYRWLRDRPEIPDAAVIDVVVWENCEGTSLRGEELDRSLDAAIDARTKAETEKGPT